MLPNGDPGHVLLNRLKASIPTKLRDHAHLVTGSFDKGVTRLGRVSVAQIFLEHILEVFKTDNRKFNVKHRFSIHFCNLCGKRGQIARDCEKKDALGSGRRDLQGAQSFNPGQQRAANQ